MLPGSRLAVAITALASLARAQYGYSGLGAYYGAGSGYGGMGFGSIGYGSTNYGGMNYGGVGYAGTGYAGAGLPGMGYYGASMGGLSSPWAYGSAGGFIPTGMGHGIIQGASTSGAIIRGPSGTIIAAPQSAGSIVF
ncbi:hypothetical protein GGI06_003850 [Coemansia sp. S85]|nr:hypothetical protein GGI06_003850 [Coemansia sp. S85]